MQVSSPRRRAIASASSAYSRRRRSGSCQKISTPSCTSSLARMLESSGPTALRAASSQRTRSVSISPTKLQCPARVGQRCLGEQIGVAKLGRHNGGLEEGLSVLGLGRHALGSSKADHRRAAPSGRFFEVFDGLERLAENCAAWSIRVAPAPIHPLRRHTRELEDLRRRSGGSDRRARPRRLRVPRETRRSGGGAWSDVLHSARHRGWSAQVHA